MKLKEKYEHELDTIDIISKLQLEKCYDSTLDFHDIKPSLNDFLNSVQRTHGADTEGFIINYGKQKMWEGVRGAMSNFLPKFLGNKLNNNDERILESDRELTDKENISNWYASDN